MLYVPPSSPPAYEESNLIRVKGYRHAADLHLAALKQQQDALKGSGTCACIWMCLTVGGFNLIMLAALLAHAYDFKLWERMGW